MQIAKIVTSARDRDPVVSVPLLKHPGLRLVVAPGPFRRTIMGWIESDQGGTHILAFEAPKDQCCALQDQFDPRIAEVTIGSTTIRVAAEHRLAVARALRW